MADILIKVDETVMSDIAKAIMAKTGKSDPLKITQFAEEIGKISGSGESSGYSDLACLGIEYWYEVGSTDSLSGEEESVDSGYDAISDLSTYSRNSSALPAYSSMMYDNQTHENICTYIGGSGHELLYLAKTLTAGKKYTFSLDYYNPSNVVGEYEEPYAPFIGFFKNDSNVINKGTNAYKNKYAATLLPVGVMTGYNSYQCVYTPSSTLNNAFIGFGTGCTLDGVNMTIYIKNIKFIEEDA